MSLADELRHDIQRLAVDIGERNVENRPRQLALAADYIETQFEAAGYEANRQAYPAIMVTDTAPFRFPHYHKATDTIDKVNFDRMARVVRGLDKVVAELVGVA